MSLTLYVRRSAFSICTEYCDMSILIMCQVQYLLLLQYYKQLHLFGYDNVVSFDVAITLI